MRAWAWASVCLCRSLVLPLLGPIFINLVSRIE